MVAVKFIPDADPETRVARQVAGSVEICSPNFYRLDADALYSAVRVGDNLHLPTPRRRGRRGVKSVKHYCTSCLLRLSPRSR